MPTHYEYALMSQQAYKADGGNAPANWNILQTRYREEEFGFAAVAYSNDITKEIVIAIRGTNNLENIYTDFQLAWGSSLNTLPFADEFITEVQENAPADYSISITGHSLGASIAEICACKYSLKAVTFESPGCKLQVENNEQYPDYENADIATYLSAPNIINTCNIHIGKIYRVHISHVQGIDLNHAIRGLSGTYYRYEFFINPTASMLKWILPRNTPGISGNSLMRESVSSMDRSVAVAGSVAWVKRQHSIDNIVIALNQDGEQSAQATLMRSWPSKTQYNVLRRLSGSMYEKIPFHPATPGIHNMFDPNKYLEALIARIPGYVQEDIEQNQVEGSASRRRRNFAEYSQNESATEENTGESESQRMKLT